MVLRGKDAATAQAWFSAIHATVSDLMTRVITEVREQLGSVGLAGGREIRHLGWLAEKVRRHPPSRRLPQTSPARAAAPEVGCLIPQAESLSRMSCPSPAGLRYAGLCVFSNFDSPTDSPVCGKMQVVTHWLLSGWMSEQAAGEFGSHMYMGRGRAGEITQTHNRTVSLAGKEVGIVALKRYLCGF